MNKQEFNSLGVTRQLAYINRLENINKQKQDLIEQLQINYELAEVLRKGYTECIDELKKENKTLREELKPWLDQNAVKGGY